MEICIKERCLYFLHFVKNKQGFKTNQEKRVFLSIDHDEKLSVRVTGISDIFISAFMAWQV